MSFKFWYKNFYVPSTTDKILACVGLIVFGVGIGYAIWGVQEPKIISIPQHQTESSEGVKQAASEAGVEISKEQADEIAADVPKAQKEYTVTTTVKDLPETAEAERKKAEADYSMITDPKNPEKSFDLSKYESTLPIELNQYNVRAYKKRLRGINYYPSTITDWKPAMISADYSVKVSDSGKYLGVTAAYNWDSKKVYAGLRYEF
jgi:hypothetical protein